MAQKRVAPFTVGQKVSWEIDFYLRTDSGNSRRTGFVVSVEWVRTDGGFWQVWATSNGKAFHPVTNRVHMLRASADKFQTEK